jgi:hypothetical protein
MRGPRRMPMQMRVTKRQGRGRKKQRPTDGAEAERELGLWEVEKRLFADNQSARDVLEELGLEILDEKEARRLLRLRVELAG